MFPMFNAELVPKYSAIDHLLDGHRIQLDPAGPYHSPLFFFLYHGSTHSATTILYVQMSNLEMDELDKYH